MGFVRETGKYMALSLVALCHAVFLLSFAFKIELTSKQSKNDKFSRDLTQNFDVDSQSISLKMFLFWFSDLN